MPPQDEDTDESSSGGDYNQGLAIDPCDYLSDSEVSTGSVDLSAEQVRASPGRARGHSSRWNGPYQMSEVFQEHVTRQSHPRTCQRPESIQVRGQRPPPPLNRAGIKALALTVQLYFCGSVGGKVPNRPELSSEVDLLDVII